MAWTLGVFFALEAVLAYVIEPWLYGRSAGLSPLAIITAVVFWTWLWGPIGLLLATPLTVCVAVMGRHIPELGFLNLLLGVEPVLSPEERFYQRLIALDHEEAQQLAESHVAAHGIAATFDDVIVPSLTLLEALVRLRDKAPVNFTVCAFTVEQGKFLRPIEPVGEYLKSRGIDWTLHRDNPSIRLIDE